MHNRILQFCSRNFLVWIMHASHTNIQVRIDENALQKDPVVHVDKAQKIAMKELGVVSTATPVSLLAGKTNVNA